VNVPGEPWRIPAHQRSTRGEVELFCDRASAGPGDLVRVFVASPSDTLVSVWRLGHEGGAGGRLVAEVGVVGASAQPPSRFEPLTGLVSCSHWSPSTSFVIDTGWASGVYAVRADTVSEPVRSADAIVVVTPAAPRDITVILPITTWAAYNGWGARSLYDGGGFNGLPRADAVSLDRPMQPVGSPIWEAVQGHPFFTWEYPLVRWLEREGFDLGYLTSLEVHRGILPTSGLIVSAGHDEYWSSAMRASLDRSLDAGASLLWCGANGLCWNIRLEASDLGSDRTMTCYKDPRRDPLLGVDDELVTSRWGEWPLRHGESDTLAVRWVDWDFSLNRHPGSWVVRAGDHPIFEGTGLRTGDVVSGIVGDEWDALDETSPAAARAVVLGESELLAGANLGPSRGHTVLHRATGGGLVMATGTTSWCWGLDASTVDDRDTAADPRLQALTRSFIVGALDGAPW
jgi:hypothetical protein